MATRRSPIEHRDDLIGFEPRQHIRAKQEAVERDADFVSPSARATCALAPARGVIDAEGVRPRHDVNLFLAIVIEEPSPPARLHEGYEDHRAGDVDRARPRAELEKLERESLKAVRTAADRV